MLEGAKKVYDQLSKNFSVKLDDRDEYSAGWKYNEWELKGVPLRLEIGPRDLDAHQVTIVRRDNGAKEAVSMHDMEAKISSTLASIQQNLLEKADRMVRERTVHAKNMKELVDEVASGNWAIAPFCGDDKCEASLKDETGGITSRCIPLHDKKVDGKCVRCGNVASVNVYFAKAY